MSPTVLHVRAETKPLEHRSAITPSIAKKLIDAGYVVNVEESPLSIFHNKEYETTGATVVPTGSWTNAPSDHIVVGLKELPEEDFPLKHVHVQFAHCYKGQGGWDTVLNRFPRGKGTLLDLEFLEDENGRRVAAFGYHAGFAGAALALMAWAWQLTHGKDHPLPGVTAYENEGALIKDVKDAVEKGRAKAGRLPRVLVIGALGRCGKGAVDLCEKAGLDDVLVRTKFLPSRSADMLTFAEMGPARNQSKARPLPRNRRIRRLRQLHLPLRQNPTLHLPRLASISQPQTQRRLRRLLRHYEPA